MKSVQIHLYTHSLNETYAVISQLSYIAGKQDPALACAKAITNAVRLNNTTAIITLANIDKRQAIHALRDLVRTYICFGATGDVRFTDPLTKREVKLLTLPLTAETAQETLDKLNGVYHLKLTCDDLKI